MKKTVSQILQEGRARVAKRWIQGEMYDIAPDGTPGYCAYGATSWAERAADAPAHDQALLALQAALPQGEFYLGAYNDDMWRTQADILALYDRALEQVTK